MSGCATTGLMSKTGLAWVTRVKEPVSATTEKAVTKTGVACNENYLGIISTGEASIERAKEKAGITEVSSVDEDFLNILMLYGKYCVIVKGN